MLRPNPSTAVCKPEGREALGKQTTALGLADLSRSALRYAGVLVEPSAGLETGAQQWAF